MEQATSFNPEEFGVQDEHAISARQQYDLTGDVSSFYCSLDPKTPDEKASLFSMLTTPDYRVDDMLGKPIDLVHVLQHTVEVVDPVTGELSAAPRVVLLDKDGKSYVGVSIGLYSAVKALIQVYGNPPFEPPIRIECFKSDTKKGKMTTFRVLKTGK